MTGTAFSGNGWLLPTLALCARCGTALAPLAAGRNRRFYTCGCQSLRDVDPMHAAIVAAGVDHNRRCTPNALRPYIIARTWSAATPDQLIRLLHQQMTHIAVDVDGAALCFWRHGHHQPTLCRPYPGSGGRRGHDHRPGDQRPALPTRINRTWENLNDPHIV